MSTDIDVVYEGGLHCMARHPQSGDVIETEPPADRGGKGEAFSPTDLVAAALGSCILTLMALFGDKNGIDLTGAQVRVSKEIINEPMRRISALRSVVTLPKGLKLTQKLRAQLEQAANACPVKQSLHPDIQTEIEFVYA